MCRAGRAGQGRAGATGQPWQGRMEARRHVFPSPPPFFLCPWFSPAPLPLGGPWRLAPGGPSSRLATGFHGHQGTPRSRQRRGGRTGESPADRPTRRRWRSQMDRIVFSSPDPHPRDGLGQSVDELAVMKHPGDPSLCFSDERSPKWGRPKPAPKTGPAAMSKFILAPSAWCLMKCHDEPRALLFPN